MDYGIALPSPADAWRTVQRAEAAGFHSAWFYDTPAICADVFVAMAPAAVATERIRLATGVLVPGNRTAPIAANALASLAAQAPGRIACGIGTGATSRMTVGLPPVRVDRMADDIRVMQAMWRGETPQVNVEGQSRTTGFVNADAGLIDIEHEIPVHVSAFGPRTMALAAEVGAGWITAESTPDFSDARASMGAFAEACRSAGRDPATMRKTLFFWGSVLRRGEDCGSSRVRAESGPFAVWMLHAAMVAADHAGKAGAYTEPAEDASPLVRMAPAYRKLYESYGAPGERYLKLHRGHLLFVRPDEQDFATAELIEASTVTASPEELRDRLRAVAETGYDEVVVQITPGQESMIEDWAGVFEGL